MNRPLNKLPQQHRLGQRAETLTRQWLVTHGYRIEDTNVRYAVGEIDIVAWDRGTLCFIEVRSTSSMEWGGPLATVTDPKRRRLVRAARCYLQRLPQIPESVRFDVIAILWPPASPPVVELVQNAFEEIGDSH